MTKYIFVAGGVMSGIGKGIAVASIGRILKSKGFKVTAIKIDPYINVDAGTMNPAGIQPNIILARSVVPLDEPRKKKISIFCNIFPQDVISAPDIESIY